jgi:hypothetical protein
LKVEGGEIADCGMTKRIQFVSIRVIRVEDFFRVFGVFRGFNRFSGCRRKKWRGFGNFVPEFFIDAGARTGRISRLVHNFI